MSAEQSAGEDRTSSLSATLCILCYNQQDYVGDALHAALRQIGEPIEIVVSDDGSSDDSLNVARKIASRYRGPHRVVVRQTPRNLGTLHHLFDVAETATGRLLVVGAADDLSLPNRVETLVTAWRRDRAAALFSNYRIIDEAGIVIEDHHHFDDSWLSINDYLTNRKLVSIHGASSAYDRELLLNLPRPAARILFEDTWLTLMLTLLDERIRHVDEPLVAYRRHAESITNFGSHASADRTMLEAADQRARRSAAANRDTIRSFKEEAIALGREDAVAMEIVDRDLRFFTAQAIWNSLSWRGKLSAMKEARQPWMRRWALLRLFGPRSRVAINRARHVVARWRSA